LSDDELLIALDAAKAARAIATVQWLEKYRGYEGWFGPNDIRED
jgi:hypothetical protein